ncbi:flagella synthesis protein FlgN [Massilia sp. LC238]|uniref:flagella synthesis protein FlgN n=1 Tax=Massilia sp. LC238 TaxID=1502852 RepID=UPI0004E3EB50|nr:flagellar protein FlgN [Massilia sp. LC238]KFC69694.1 Flagellar synthesis protein FlgN [Massilia sp. LC238]
MPTSPISTVLQEQQHLGFLIELMKQEQQLLVAADADGLAETTPRKNALLQALADLSAQRHAALLAAGCEGSEAGMEPWLAVGGNDEARTQWEALLALAREAKELNRVNGMLINKQLAHNQGVLNALRMPAGADAGGVYGASGQALGSGPSKRYVIG